MKKIISLVTLLTIAQVANAISIDWTGGYRAEYVSIDRPSLSEPKLSKAYALNFLYLQPKIIGSDGINIYSRFDIMPSQTPAYKNSQVGSLIGGGLSDGNQGTGFNSNSETQNSSSLQVSQLYLNVVHENGSLLVGRTPIEFGLGITHNAGKNPFDHWIDTKEVLAYRFLVDNIAFTPMLARVVQNDFGGGVANDQIFLFEYDNKDIGAKAGVLHQTRVAGAGNNDAYISNAVKLYPSGNSVIGGFKEQTINLFLERKWSAFEFKIEASFLTGDTGIANAAGDEIKLNSYAVVAEALKPAQESKWEYGAKFGVVSGDNPDTQASYEGYQLDRNYDLGMLLFNQRMGYAGDDVIGTRPLHANDNSNGNKLSIQNSVDDEAVSNAMFFAPSFKYLYDDKIDMKYTAVYAQAMTNANGFTNFSKDLGLELDAELIYKPRERVIWSNSIGYFMPGSAWSAGSNNRDTKANFGFASKAAITF